MLSFQPPAPGLQPLLILASSSPRRRELLEEAGYTITVIPPTEDVECGVCSESGPAGLVTELAYRKAAAVRDQLQHDDNPHDLAARSAIIVAADTVAECDGMILGKPCDETMARQMLRRLSGREHRVLTGVCIWPLNSPIHSDREVGNHLPLIRVAVTKLTMDALTDRQLDEYIASGQWEGKAGAFGYQDRLGWVHIVEGSPSNVVGLPMELLTEMLAKLSADNDN